MTDKKIDKRIDVIQAIRGIACIMVVLCHTQLTDHGQSGVDLFFIISGFVTMMSTERQGKAFWRKRIIKIIPFYWIMTIVTALAVILIPSLFRSYEVNFEYFIKSIFLIPYKHGDIKGPLLQIGWTLEFEFLFYLVFWIMMQISHKNRGIFTCIFLFVLYIFNKLLSLPILISYWRDSVLLEFSFGIIVYYIYKALRNKKVSVIPCNNSKCTIVYIIVLCVVMEILYTSISLDRAFTAGIVGVCIILGSLFDPEQKYPRILLVIGDASYFIYLSHPFVVRLVEKILNNLWNYNILTTIISVLFSLLLGTVVFKLYSHISRKVSLLCTTT